MHIHYEGNHWQSSCGQEYYLIFLVSEFVQGHLCVYVCICMSGMEGQQKSWSKPDKLKVTAIALTMDKNDTLSIAVSSSLLQPCYLVCGNMQYIWLLYNILKVSDRWISLKMFCQHSQTELVEQILLSETYWQAWCSGVSPSLLAHWTSAPHFSTRYLAVSSWPFLQGGMNKLSRLNKHYYMEANSLVIMLTVITTDQTVHIHEEH